MSHPAIIAESLSKRYRIGAVPRHSRTVKDAFHSVISAPLRNLQQLRRLVVFDATDDGPDVLWALRDVSFSLHDGEVLGVIGRNGAGKSTLLKILARITRPTTGRARVFGRMASLLEVGTGFHPELTGRDNVYLNGSILGMDRVHIARKFDDIIEFAGIARFVDTPVKRYSSGMYLRLAFAVAAHLEPEILVVDEVLAVGDVEFQQRCIRKMNDVAREGRTILFVSHNLGAIQRLCTRAIWLDEGRLVADGETTDVVRQYLASSDAATPPGQWADLSGVARSASGVGRIAAVRHSSPERSLDLRAYSAGPLNVDVRIHAARAVPRVSLGFRIRDHLGGTLMTGSTTALGSPASLPEGMSTWSFRIASLNLRPGPYQLDLWLGDSVGIHDSLKPALRLDVLDRPGRTGGFRYDPRCDGPVFCEYEVALIEPDPGRNDTRPGMFEESATDLAR